MSHPDVSHLRTGGRRLTPQRRVIWAVLHDSHTHLTAEEVWAAANAHLAELALPTVYRTLVSLIEAEEVREIPVANGPARYETVCEDNAHLDAVCRACGRIEKLRAPALAGQVQALMQRHGFQGEAPYAVIYGVCDHCA